MCYGLVWTLITSALAMRRDGFPSWSWAGWITPVKWPGWSEQCNLLDSRTETQTQIAVIKTDGSAVALTEDIVGQVLMDGQEGVSMYTYCLRIEAEILQVQFVDICAGDPDINSGIEPMMRRQFRYAAMQTTRLDGPSRQWPLHPTLSIGADDELH
jgi:hypothetical protein